MSFCMNKNSNVRKLLTLIISESLTWIHDKPHFALFGRSTKFFFCWEHLKWLRTSSCMDEVTLLQGMVHTLCKHHVIVHCNIMVTYICVTLVHGLLDINMNTCNKHVILDTKAILFLDSPLSSLHFLSCSQTRYMCLFACIN